MSSKDRPSPNTTLGIIAVTTVLVGVLGFIGWRVYSQPNKQVGTTAVNNTSTSQHIKAIETAATVTPQGTYLDIKELGIKVLLNSSTSDAVYAPYRTSSTDGSRVVGISAQSLIDHATSNYCDASGGPLGIIIETTDPSIGSPQPSNALTPDNKSVFKFGNNYYWYRPPQALGCAVGQVTSNMVIAKINAFEQAFTTTQQDN